MITLDTSTLLAILNADDPHARLAQIVLVAYQPPFYAHEVNVAETLVRAIGHETQLSDIKAFYDEFVEIVGSDGFEGALRIAEIRSASSLKIPDCFPIDVAAETSRVLATFDQKMATAARGLGLEVVPI